MSASRLYQPRPGDIIIVRKNEKVKVGKLYKNYPAIVLQVFYKPQPWYKFWQRKEVEEFHIQWLG